MQNQVSLIFYKQTSRLFCDPSVIFLLVELMRSDLDPFSGTSVKVKCSAYRIFTI